MYNEMLSYSSRILGQSQMFNMQGKNTIRRSALDAFLNAARSVLNNKAKKKKFVLPSQGTNREGQIGRIFKFIFLNLR